MTQSSETTRGISLHSVDQPDSSSDPERTSRFCSVLLTGAGGELDFTS